MGIQIFTRKTKKNSAAVTFAQLLHADRTVPRDDIRIPTAAFPAVGPTASSTTAATAAIAVGVVVAVACTIRIDGAGGARTGFGVAVEGEGRQTHLCNHSIQFWE